MAGCQKKEVPAQPPAPPAAEVAQVAVTATQASDQEPEPEQPPCKSCSVDMDGRITGLWQPARCWPANTADVGFPASGAHVEVVSGAQKGETFAIDSSPAVFQVGEGYAGSLPAGAKPEGWSEARLWIKDSSGALCRSALAIQR